MIRLIAEQFVALPSTIKKKNYRVQLKRKLQVLCMIIEEKVGSAEKK